MKIPAALLFTCCTFCTAAWAQAPGPNDPVLKPDSPYMDELRARPVPGDLAALLLVREAYFFARDPKGREAVDNLLAAMAMAQLEGRTLPPVPGTIGDLVASPPAPPTPPTKDEAGKLLDASVKPLLAGPDDMDASLVDRSEGVLHRIAPGLWATDNEIGSPKTLWVPLRVENTSGRRVEEYGAWLLIDGARPPAIRLACTRNVRKARMDAGQSSFALCSNQGRGAERIEELKDALAKLPSDPSRWRLEVSHVNFADPPVGVHRNGHVFFLKTGARDDVRRDLQATECRRRGACWAEMDRYIFDWHPETLLVPAGIAVALVNGFWIGRRSDHISRSVLKVFLVLCLFALAAIAWAIVAGKEWAIVLVIVVALGAASAIATFMIFTMVGVAFGRWLRSSRRETGV